MKTRTRVALAAAVTSMLALSACSANGGSGEDSKDDVSVVGFSILEKANDVQFEDFEGTDNGKDVTFTKSYGASGDQSRAVEGGLDADVVQFSLEPDMIRLVDADLVADDWNTGPSKGIVTSSVVSFMVRPGNPKNINGWDDLVKPGVEVITPNPASSGSAKWNILGAWGHVLAQGGSEADAKAFVTKLLNNTIALPASARDATTAFTEGNGDVLISYENEAILAKQSGAEVDYLVPEDTLLIQNPGAVTTEASDHAKDFLDFLLTPEAQATYASFGFRPVVDGVTIPEVDGANDPSDPFPTPKTLLTIDEDFGGWADANTKFFDENDGIITQLQAETGKTGDE